MLPLRIVICPNCSLSARGALLFFVSLCGITCGIAGLLTAFGLWPMLPIAGAEMVVLGWALHESLARRFQTQTITVTESHVSIESCDRAACRREVFQRHWAQIKLCPIAASRPSRLTIESHGHRCELGGFLTEEERRGLALRLRRLVGRIDESPPLALGHG